MKLWGPSSMMQIAPMDRSSLTDDDGGKIGAFPTLLSSTTQNVKSSTSRRKERLQAARRIFEHIAGVLDASFSVRLWDDTIVPLGSEADPRYFISISGPGVIGSILRRPRWKTSCATMHRAPLTSAART
jgi:hypothetical protein